MRLLLDTQLLLWLIEWQGPDTRPAPAQAVELAQDAQNELFFSAVSIWEIAIKAALKRTAFDADPRRVHQALIDHGYVELPVTAVHASAVADLPLLHGDPFDRLLVAQARSEGLTLLTVDAQLARYPGPIRKV